MQAPLPKPLREFVNNLIESGEFNSQAEVVLEALYLFKDHEEFKRIRLNSLRKEIAVGLEQAERGEVAPFDAERIKREGRKLLKAKRKAG